MSIVAGQTASASDFISASAGSGSSGQIPKLNANGKLDVSFSPVIGCKAIQTGTQSYSTTTVLTFGGESFDTDTMHDNVTNNSRLTFKTAGTWLIGASVRANAGSSWIGLQLRLNGTTIIGYGGGSVNGNGDGGAALTLVRVFSVNDYIELLANAGTTETTTGDEATNFWAIRLFM